MEKNEYVFVFPENVGFLKRYNDLSYVVLYDNTTPNYFYGPEYKTDESETLIPVTFDLPKGVWKIKSKDKKLNKVIFEKKYQ